MRMSKWWTVHTAWPARRERGPELLAQESRKAAHLKSSASPGAACRLCCSAASRARHPGGTARSARTPATQSDPHASVAWQMPPGCRNGFQVAHDSGCAAAGPAPRCGSPMSRTADSEHGMAACGEVASDCMSSQFSRGCSQDWQKAFCNGDVRELPTKLVVQPRRAVAQRMYIPSPLDRATPGHCATHVLPSPIDFPSLRQDADERPQGNA